MKDLIGKTFYDYQEKECKIIDKGKKELSDGDKVTLYLYEEKTIINGEVKTFNRVIKESDIKRLLDKQDKIIDQINKKQLRKQKEKVEKERKRKEYNDIKGFAANKSKMHKGRILKTLNRKQMYNGELYKRKHFIEKAISEGYTVTNKTIEGENKRVLIDTEGKWFEDLTKTELDYAEYLIANKEKLSA